MGLVAPWRAQGPLFLWSTHGVRRFNDLGTMEESVEECVENVRSAWEFWRVCRRRNNTQFALLRAVPGSGKTSKHCKPSPRYQTTESQRGLGEGKATRPMCGLRRWSKYTQTIKFYFSSDCEKRKQMSPSSYEYARSHADSCTEMYVRTARLPVYIRGCRYICMLA
jgi:hypothetical protein